MHMSTQKILVNQHITQNSKFHMYDAVDCGTRVKNVKTYSTNAGITS